MSEPRRKWDSSTRSSRLPGNWASLRLSALRRDAYKCVFCGAEATEVDHADAGDDHSLENLQSVCRNCHTSKTHQEGTAARMRRLRELRAMTKRKPEQHPGFIPPAERRNRPQPRKGW